MRAELERNYSRLRTGIDNPNTLTLPRNVHSNYADPAISDLELVAYGYHSALTNPNYFKTMLPVSSRILREWIKSNPELAKVVVTNGVAAVTLAAALGTTGEGNEAKASPPRNPQGNIPSNLASLPGTFTPVGLGTEAMKASAYGWPEIAKALSGRKPIPLAPRNEKFRDLVRTLANLKARQKSQPYGGPR